MIRDPSLLVAPLRDTDEFLFSPEIPPDLVFRYRSAHHGGWVYADRPAEVAEARRQLGDAELERKLARHAYSIWTSLHWPGVKEPDGRWSPRDDFACASVALWETWPRAQDVFASDGTSCEAPSGPLQLWESTQAGGAILTDLNGMPAYYELRVNPDYFLYLFGRDGVRPMDHVRWRLTTLSGQREFFAAGGAVQFPHGNYEFGVTGAIEIKTSWRVLGDGEGYGGVTRSAEIQREDGAHSCKVELAGMHIAHKTKNYPHWIWATFEHVRAAPCAARMDEQPYMFYRDSAATPRNKPQPAGQPSQIVRELKVSDPVAEVNAAMQSAFAQRRPELAQYQLIGVQTQAQSSGWQTRGASSPRLTNCTMESFNQGLSALEEHRLAKTASGHPADFSWLLRRAH